MTVSRTGLWIITLLLAAVSLWLRWPLLDRAISNDEQITVTANVHGAWHTSEIEPPSALMDDNVPAEERLPKLIAWVEAHAQWRPATWSDCFFVNTGHNNSAPFSIAARLFDQAFRHVHAMPEGVASVQVLRLPALIAGVASVCLLFLLFQDRIGVIAALGAALWLMVHPDHIEFSARARGYSFAMLLMVLAVHHLIRACEQNTAGSWLRFHVSSILLIYASSGAVYPAAALMVIGFATACGMRRLGWGRWLALAMLPWLVLGPLVIPSLLSARDYVRHEYPYTRYPAHHVERLWNEYALGVRSPPAPPNTSLAPIWDKPQHDRAHKPAAQPGAALHPQQPWLRLVGWAVMPLLFMAGGFAMWRQSRLLLACCAGVGASAWLAVLHQKYLLGVYGLSWYYLYILPAMALMVGASLRLLPGWRSALLTALPVVTLWAWAIWPDGTRWRLDYRRAPGTPMLVMRVPTPGDRWITLASGHTVHLGH